MLRCFALCLVISTAACSTTTTTPEIVTLANDDLGLIVNDETLSEQDLIDLNTGGDNSNADPEPVDDGSPVIRTFDLIADMENANLEALSNSRFDAIPATGSATFSGGLGVTVWDSDFIDFTALGIVDINANFSDKTLAVENDGFIVYRSGIIVGLSEATGSIDLTSGVIGARRPNSVDFVISGEVVSDEATIAIDGNLNGSFKGSPELKGIFADQGSGLALINGERANRVYVELRALPD